MINVCREDLDQMPRAANQSTGLGICSVKGFQLLSSETKKPIFEPHGGGNIVCP